MRELRDRYTLLTGREREVMFRNLLPRLADKYHVVAPD
jgi:hypothetical protein